MEWMRQLLRWSAASLGWVLPVDVWLKALDPGRLNSQAQQRQLWLTYQALARAGGPLPSLEEVEFRCYSQNGEDGILLYLLALAGTINRRCVELGAGNGIECNSANLILNHGWTGLLLDGNAANIARGRHFYRWSRDTWLWPPILEQAWVTAENVNTLLSQYEMTGEIDLLSLDLDGIDWWVWRALEAASPRLVVVEYQDILGPEVAWSVPYQADFVASRHAGRDPDYAGASLNAFVLLGRAKGYRLVGCQRYGFNAFFLRHDVGAHLLPEVSPVACFQHPKTAWGRRVRWPRVSQRQWVDVSQLLDTSP